MGDIRHQFVLWWISLFVLWNIFAVMAATAQLDQQSLSPDDVGSLNMSNQTASLESTQSLFDQLVQFHVGNAWIDLMFGITGAFALYVIATVFFGVGG